MTCYTSNQTLNIPAVVGGGAEIGFDSESPITIRFKLFNPISEEQIDIEDITTDPTGPTCSLDNSVSPTEAVATFSVVATTIEYSINLDHEDLNVQRSEFIGPTTLVTITAKPNC